jgi:hypothetical protein
MKLTKFILPVVSLILAITLVVFIPKIEKGRRISQYQNQLTQLSNERNACEKTQSTNSAKAQQVRDALSKEIGVSNFIQEGASQTAQTIIPQAVITLT